MLLLPNSFSHDATRWPEGSALLPTDIAEAARSNYTVVLHNVELYWRPLALLSAALQRHFGLYSQADVRC